MRDKGLASYAKASYNVSMTDAEARKAIRAFFSLYRGVKKYQAALLSNTRRTGYVRVNWLGEPCRVRPVPDIMSHDRGKRGAAERVTLNTPIQGGAMEYTLRFMLRLHKAIKSGTVPGVRAIVGTVHDSVWLTVDKRKVKDAFMSASMLAVSLPTINGVPLEVEAKAGPSLGTMEYVGDLNSLDVDTGGLEFDDHT